MSPLGRYESKVFFSHTQPFSGSYPLIHLTQPHMVYGVSSQRYT